MARAQTTGKTRTKQTPAPAAAAAAAAQTSTEPTRDPNPATDPEAEAAAALAAKKAAEAAAWTEAMRVDWQAERDAGAFLGTFEDYLALQRVGVGPRERYTGRMLALVAARQNYVKGGNGNQHSGDWIGVAFQNLPRTEVVRCCMEILHLEANPYTHLNPGQQSMNLRNKVRGACQRGEIPVEHVKTVIAKYTAA